MVWCTNGTLGVRTATTNKPMAYLRRGRIHICPKGWYSHPCDDRRGGNLVFGDGGRGEDNETRGWCIFKYASTHDVCARWRLEVQQLTIFVKPVCIKSFNIIPPLVVGLRARRSSAKLQKFGRRGGGVVRGQLLGTLVLPGSNRALCYVQQVVCFCIQLPVHSYGALHVCAVSTAPPFFTAPSCSCCCCAPLLLMPTLQGQAAPQPSHSDASWLCLC